MSPIKKKSYRLFCFILTNSSFPPNSVSEIRPLILISFYFPTFRVPRVTQPNKTDLPELAFPDLLQEGDGAPRDLPGGHVLQGGRRSCCPLLALLPLPAPCCAIAALWDEDRIALEFGSRIGESRRKKWFGE